MTSAHRPYSPSPECRYFLYDPNDGHTFYRTPEERDAAAKDLIQDYLSDGEWSEEVVDIYAGEATHRVIETERLDKAGELDEDWYDENGEYWESNDIDYKCNHGLRPLVPPPTEGEVAPPADPFPDVPERLRHCPTHGQQPANAWGCPECVRELRQAAELERLHSAAPVAWLYRGEPDYAGQAVGWRCGWVATTSQQLAEFKSLPGKPIPLFPAHALPLPSGGAANG